MNNLQNILCGMVKTVIVNTKVVTEKEIDDKVSEVKLLPMFSILKEEEIEEVRNSIKSEYFIKLDKGILIEEQNHEKWFLKRKASIELSYWNRYKQYLMNDKKFSTNVINSMDDILDTQVDLLGDPARDITYNRRGLIIGDVQSGKTANYTGLICKAVDAEYKVVVLLTGTLEKLRRQTQQRIDEGFVGADSEAMMKQREDGQIIGAGKYNPSIRPMVLTSTSDDFKAQNAKNLGFDLRNINGSVIFVVKKNVAILKRLNKWFKTFNQNGENQIEQSILVIDDESDNASVNTNDDDREPTAINAQIREMLKAFTKSSYVGYTATPFANIFIDPESIDKMNAEDLFPKDYIYSLSAPTNYVGARNIFLEDSNEHYMLVEIDNNPFNPKSIEALIPQKHKSGYHVKNIPDDMKTAIELFVLANAIEDYRGNNDSHRSMLINISRFTDVQNQISDCVNEYLKNIQDACRLYCKMPIVTALNEKYIKKLFDTYNSIYNSIGISWNEIQESLYASCASIKVVTINRKSSQNLNYEEYDKDGLRVIAVGGLSLSRGLTLEGLIISYFYRNSRMYDTLMQMGRWFGYRKGYGDLCRIWMSEESIEWYAHISFATDELREEIKRYHDTDLTPLDFGLRVRSDINTLLVTARNKMRSASSIECAISLSGVTIETPELYADADKNEYNHRMLKKFYADLKNKGHDIETYNSKVYGFTNISSSLITEFLEDFEISPKNEQFNVKSIIRFIKDYAGDELERWDIAFATGSSEKTYTLDINAEWNYPRRSYSIENNGKIIKISGSKRRLGTSTDGKIWLDPNQIRMIESRTDKNTSQKEYFIDIKRRPLLTIYLIDLVSDKSKVAYDKEITEAIKSTFESSPAVGLGIGIPSLSDQKTMYAKYIINKVASQQIFDEELDIGDDE